MKPHAKFYSGRIKALFSNGINGVGLTLVIIHHKLNVDTSHATKKPHEAAFCEEVDDETEGFRLFLRPVAG